MTQETASPLMRHAPLLLRIALAAAFLSAVADRFGIWGAAGTPGVVWGDFAAFVEATAALNPWFPAPVIAPLAWFVTALEVALAVLLLVGVQLRKVALVSTGLLVLFMVGMIVGYGLKSIFDYSVVTAAAASLLLASVSRD
jgi:uncharacterized membrane protein YphA (DoxX/SURF4 family)